jgi:hypothetical protein
MHKIKWPAKSASKARCLPEIIAGQSSGGGLDAQTI